MGIIHPGFDCFVFKRSAYPNYIMGNICIGINWVGTVLLWNLQVFSNSFSLFDKLHLTFHIGDDKSWKNPKFADYVFHNKTEAKKIYLQLQQENMNFSDQKHWELL
jgi:hypothetical protein